CEKRSWRSGGPAEAAGEEMEEEEKGAALCALAEASMEESEARGAENSPPTPTPEGPDCARDAEAAAAEEEGTSAPVALPSRRRSLIPSSSRLRASRGGGRWKVRSNSSSGAAAAAAPAAAALQAGERRRDAGPLGVVYVARIAVV